MANDVLDSLLDSWDRNNRVLLNLLRLVPEDALEARALPDSPTVGQMFAHLHHERMISVEEEAPESAGAVPSQEWEAIQDPERIARMLEDSGARVRDAVLGRIQAGRNLELNFDHPAQLIPFLIFHEAYHHGQIKLALKAAGRPVSNNDAGPLTWDVWRKRRR